MSSINPLKNIIIIGGSYVGRAIAQELASIIPSTHRVLLAESHSHFHHLFAFPRFSVVGGHEHKAFIPYTALFSSLPNPTTNAVIRARVLSIQPQHILLDREWQHSSQIPFEYLVVATGTTLSEPGTMKHDDKASSVTYLQSHQEKITAAKSILIIGGGAVGVQMATDLKELYPSKKITLVQSRARLMPQFNPQLHEMITQRFKDLSINLITNTRAILPPSFSQSSQADRKTPLEINLTNGTTESADFVILATGQRPNNSLVKDLTPSSADSLINPKNGYVRVKPTLQFLDEQYPNLFAVGDVADTGAHKAARAGVAQASVAAKNILALVEGREPVEKYVAGPAGIHLTLGLRDNVKFGNGMDINDEPRMIIRAEDGQEDMHIEGMWARHGLKDMTTAKYHL